MVETAPASDDVSRLLAQADSTPLARRHVETLANAAPVGRLTEALEQAIESAHLYASTILALAIGAAGGRISAHLAHLLIPDLEDMEYVPIIAGIIEGDRVTALLDLAANQRLSWEREALVLFLATRLLEGQEPPPRLIAQLRTLAREPINPMIGIVVGFAAHELANSEIDALAADFLPMARAAAQRGVHDVMSRGLFSPVLDSIPEEAAPRVVSGYTVVRTEPKVGRNDPCPCGSGRKYKKCCADREHEVSSHPSRVEQFQKLGRAGRLQEQIFDLMRPVELATLDPGQLTTIQLIKGTRKLSAHHRWDSAERFMDVLSRRTDSPGGNPDGYRVDLAYEAIKAGELDLAERQMALASPSEGELTRFGVRIALARKHPDALVRLESALNAGHNGDPLFLIDGAFALLDYFPALGILAARGCISAERLLDSEALLEDIGRARDRLNLPAEEPWWDIFDLLLGEDFGPRHHPPAPGSGGDQQRIGQQQIEGLRAELQTANARVSRLSQELETRVHQLEEVSEEREKLATMVEAAHSDEDRKRVSDLEAERQRLRAKIGELKGEITEGGAQRAELRRELARTADDLRRQTPVQTPADPAEIDDHDEAESDTTVEHPRRILVPHFSTPASRSLNTVPTRVASGALHEVALLASGDAHAWSGAKHMRRAHDILSVRIGRTYRLLFRIADDRLDLLDLINRRDLDAAIHRLAGR